MVFGQLVNSVSSMMTQTTPHEYFISRTIDCIWLTIRICGIVLVLGLQVHTEVDLRLNTLRLLTVAAQ